MLAGEKLSQFILKICAYNPDERYASATEAKKALYEILSEMSSEERSYWVVPPPLPMRLKKLTILKK